MDEHTRKSYEKPKPREQRVMEHAAETENGGMPPPRPGGSVNAPGPEATRGGEPPQPVQPPQEPGVSQRSHR
jgi:hypothetical protein